MRDLPRYAPEIAEFYVLKTSHSTVAGGVLGFWRFLFVLLIVVTFFVVDTHKKKCTPNGHDFFANFFFFGLHMWAEFLYWIQLGKRLSRSLLTAFRF